MDRLLELIKKGIPILGIAAIGYMGEHGTDGGFIKDIWTAAKTASPLAAMFAILAWLDERRERREAQKQCNDRTIEFVKATNLAISTFDRTTSKLQEERRERRRR
jgi:hypothetical protein